MQQELVDKIKQITADLAETIDNLKPGNGLEWEAKEALTAAHKQLRKIDADSLSERERKAIFTR
jgi:exonuclease VII small subunit